MKLLGMIGGTGPESTIDYYRLFIAAFLRRKPGIGAPPVVINSIAGDQLLSLLNASDFDGVRSTLLLELSRLEKAGAQLALLTSCTLHIVFDDLEPVSPIPLISIVRATCEAVKAHGLKSVGLLGTRLTMQGGFFQRVFTPEGIGIVTPSIVDQEYLQEQYFGELVHGVFRQETRDRVIAVAERMRTRERIEGVIMGGTELPLLLRDARDLSIPLFDTTRLHVEQAVSELLSAAA